MSIQKQILTNYTPYIIIVILLGVISFMWITRPDNLSERVILSKIETEKAQRRYAVADSLLKVSKEKLKIQYKVNKQLSISNHKRDLKLSALSKELDSLRIKRIKIVENYVSKERTNQELDNYLYNTINRFKQY